MRKDRSSRTAEPLGRTFDSAADIYDAARPSYPEQLFDDLVKLAGLEAGSRLLEIGCATGKATKPLLQRGFSVVCVSSVHNLLPSLAAALPHPKRSQTRRRRSRPAAFSVTLR